MAAALGLDAESRAGLSRVMERAGQRRQALGRQEHEAYRALEKLFEEPLPDQQAVMARIDELADLEAHCSNFDAPEGFEHLSQIPCGDLRGQVAHVDIHAVLPDVRPLDNACRLAASGIVGIAAISALSR